ncbi:MAG: hypothetical protein KDD69_14010 [Bdellovibrionales bacterium]|nr:hypothetical protein [Bdellovibrionales bacterium]
MQLPPLSETISLSAGTALLATVLLLIVMGGSCYVLLTLLRRMRKLNKVVAEALSDQQEQLSSSAFSVEDAIGSFKRRVEEEKARREKEDAARRKLIADVSHDLRTPITAIQGYIETLITLEEKLSATERRDFLESALRNTQAITLQIQDMLTAFARPSEGRRAQKKEFPLNELFRDLEARFVQRASQKGVSLYVANGEAKVNVYADRALMDRAISNLLANSLRYTPAGGTIRLDCEQKPATVEIAVADTGIGIPESDLPHVVERFYRVDKDRSRSTGGTGLGLAIAKEILDSHGAQFNVTSEVGRGTRIWFELERRNG